VVGEVQWDIRGLKKAEKCLSQALIELLGSKKAVRWRKSAFLRGLAGFGRLIVLMSRVIKGF